MESLVLAAPRKLEFCESPRPDPAPGEALVKVAACGVCGSDMHAYLGHDPRRPAPLILGHEAAGEVVEGSRPGAHVAVNPLVVCGERAESKCRHCKAGRDNLCTRREILSMPPRPGAFAEYVCIPEENLVYLPDEFPYVKAALFEPLACAHHAVRLARELSTFPLQDSNAVVIGGGAIGLGSALALAAEKTGKVCLVEANALRHPALLSAAEHFPQITIAAPEGAPEHAELVIDAVGSAASRDAAFRVAMPGSVIVHIGLASSADGVDSRKLTLQEIVYCGAYTYTKSDFAATADKCLNGGLGDLSWALTRRLEEGAEVFREAEQNQIPAPKVVLEPGT